jgi:hypothetical protein
MDLEEVPPFSCFLATNLKAAVVVFELHPEIV